MRWLIIFCLFVRCTPEINTSKVSYDMLLNDGNSKVWVIETEIVNDINIAPYLIEEKHLLIFYSDGTFSYGPMKSLGRMAYSSGDYWLDSDKNKLSFEFSQMNMEFAWDFTISEIYEDSIFLTPEKNAAN
ncbi:MAG: hypothetical protein MK066_15025, partial [Crocinitomicaceae bacterium]|nr:hypothetical protein [Crocinitomicaceae bacterium]